MNYQLRSEKQDMLVTSVFFSNQPLNCYVKKINIIEESMVKFFYG